MQGGSKNSPRCRAGAKTALDAGREQKHPSMQGGSKNSPRCRAGAKTALDAGRKQKDPSMLKDAISFKKNAIFLDLP